MRDTLEDGVVTKSGNDFVIDVTNAKVVDRLEAKFEKILGKGYTDV